MVKTTFDKVRIGQYLLVITCSATGIIATVVGKNEYMNGEKNTQRLKLQVTCDNYIELDVDDICSMNEIDVLTFMNEMGE